MAQRQAKPASSATRGSGRSNDDIEINVATSQHDSMELTPAPMVVASSRDGTPTAPRVLPQRVRHPTEQSGFDSPVLLRADRCDARDPEQVRPRAKVEDPDVLGSELNSLKYKQAEYHPPREPPTSVVPPPAPATFSVAPQYDPKAPTRPKVRRNTSAPPPPLLFGLDRMLVWGLVLGGLFVAVIVILVRQLALPSPGTGRGSAKGVDQPVQRDQVTRGSPQINVPAPVTDHQASARSAAPIVEPAREFDPVTGPERGGLDAGVQLSRAVQTAAVSRDSTNLPSERLTEKQRSTGSGGLPGVPNGPKHPSPTRPLPRKSWIE